MKQCRGAIRMLRSLVLTALLAFGITGWGLPPAAQSPDTVQKIQQLLQAGDTATAQALLSTALQESPGNGGLYNLQGVLKVQQGDFAVAETAN